MRIIIHCRNSQGAQKYSLRSANEGIGTHLMFVVFIYCWFVGCFVLF